MCVCGCLRMFVHVSVVVSVMFACVCLCVCAHDHHSSPPQLACPITGSVEQMKARNKYDLYLVRAVYVLVSSGFILGKRVQVKWRSTAWSCSQGSWDM